MALGRKTGGRQKGTKNKHKGVIKRRASKIPEALNGQSPLEYMLEVMRDSSAEKGRRDDMARAAAPYMHPRMAAVEMTGKDGAPLFDLQRLTDQELDAIEELVRKATAVVGGDPGGEAETHH